MIEESKVIEVLAEALLLEPKDISIDADLTSFENYDSVSLLSLMVALSDLTGTSVEPCTMQKLKSGKDILAFVNKGGH